MDQLSSCYFCGGALDVSLSEYPIIPKSLEPDAESQGTVVLCSTCREKLGSIVEPVVEAATNDVQEAAAADTGEPPGLLDDSGTPSVDSQRTDSVVAPDDDGSLLGDDTTDERDPSDLSEDEFTPHPANASEQSEDSMPDSGEPETDESDTTETSPAAATEPDDMESDAAETDSESEDGADPRLTKLEYNKVMRLLKNRQMPVDRAEIRDVAVNAYDIDGEQFDTIIDAAVERDLIGQENGQLVEAN